MQRIGQRLDVQPGRVIGNDGGDRFAEPLAGRMKGEFQQAGSGRQQPGGAPAGHVRDQVGQGEDRRRHAETVRGDEYFYRGTENGEPVDAVPFEVTMDVLERGQSLYNAFCTPCHGFVGNGDGAVALEGIAGEGNVPPASFHNEDLAAQPIGYYVQVMTEGKGMMYSYAGRIEPADRWAVAAYVRALQLSQKAAFDAMPADVQEQISAVQ